MAIIDYSLIRSGKYSSLSPSAKALIPVLSTLCDNFTGAIPEKDSKARVLASYAGISIRSVQDALLELSGDTYKIVSMDTHSGRPPSIQYLPVIQISKLWSQAQEVGNGCRPEDPKLGNGCRGDTPLSPPENPPQPPSSQAIPTTAISLLPLNNKDLTTTKLPVPKILIKEMISAHGPGVVVKVISGMEKKAAAGEIIEYPGAYFRRCCANGWEPTSKAIQDKEKAGARRAAAAAAEADHRLLQEEHALKVRQEQADPAAQARISHVQEEFWATLDADPDSASGHGQPANRFRTAHF